MGSAEQFSAGVGNPNGIAGLGGSAIDHVTRKNPRMAGLDTVTSFAVHADSGDGSRHCDILPSWGKVSPRRRLEFSRFTCCY